VFGIFLSLDYATTNSLEASITIAIFDLRFEEFSEASLCGLAAIPITIATIRLLAY